MNESKSDYLSVPRGSTNEALDTTEYDMFKVNKLWHVLGFDLERERIIHNFYVFAPTAEMAKAKLERQVREKDELTKFIPFSHPPFDELKFVLNHVSDLNFKPGM